MATVNKDFRIKAGLVVEGANATVNGEDIITTGSSTDDLQEGSTNVYFTDGRAKDSAASLLTNATLTNITITGTGNGGLTITAENGVADSDTDDLAEGTTNLYFTNQRALDATASAYDVAGAASAAQTAAEAYADTVGTNTYNNAVTAAANDATSKMQQAESYADQSALDAENNAKSYADSLATNYDPAGSATTAEQNANTYTDTALESYTPTSSLDTTIDGYGYLKSADLSGYATETYVGTAIDNLVDGAPGLLDTLNELAAAINDDANYATTMTTALAGKQDSLTAGNGISIDGSTDTISVDTSVIADKTYVDNAVSTGVGDINSDDVPEGTTNLYFTDQRAIDAVQNTTPTFASVDVTWVRKEEATWTNAATAGTYTAHTFGTNKGSVKYLVRVINGTHSQVSEVLVTTDASNNIAVLEYGTIYTSENELATITADWDAANSQYRLRVTTANNTSEVLVAATLLSYND